MTTWIYYAGLQPVVEVATGDKLLGQVTLCPAVLGQVQMRDFLAINADNSIAIDRVQFESDRGVFINDALATVELKDENDITLESNPMTYVPGSQGRYEGVISKVATALLTEGTFYFVDVSIVKDDNDGFRRLRKIARYHGATP